MVGLVNIRLNICGKSLRWQKLKYFAGIGQEERRNTMTYVMNAGVRDEISIQDLSNTK
jgi:hypothetical protein